MAALIAVQSQKYTIYTIKNTYIWSKNIYGQIHIYDQKIYYLYMTLGVCLDTYIYTIYSQKIHIYYLLWVFFDIWSNRLGTAFLSLVALDPVYVIIIIYGLYNQKIYGLIC
jgi:hypothetical protein